MRLRSVEILGVEATTQLCESPPAVSTDGLLNSDLFDPGGSKLFPLFG